MRGRPRKNDVALEKHVEIVEKYKNGVGMFDLANEYQVTVYIIRDILVLNDVPIRKAGNRTGKKKTFTDLAAPFGE